MSSSRPDLRTGFKAFSQKPRGDDLPSVFIKRDKAWILPESEFRDLSFTEQVMESEKEMMKFVVNNARFTQLDKEKAEMISGTLIPKLSPNYRGLLVLCSDECFSLIENLPKKMDEERETQLKERLLKFNFEFVEPQETEPIRRRGPVNLNTHEVCSKFLSKRLLTKNVFEICLLAGSVGKIIIEKSPNYSISIVRRFRQHRFTDPQIVREFLAALSQNNSLRQLGNYFIDDVTYRGPAKYEIYLSWEDDMLKGMYKTVINLKNLIDKKANDEQIEDALKSLATHTQNLSSIKFFPVPPPSEEPAPVVFGIPV